MKSYEIFETLSDKGFSVKVDEAHTTVFVMLSNRKVSFMEIEAALDYKVNRHRMFWSDSAIAISE